MGDVEARVGERVMAMIDAEGPQPDQQTIRELRESRYCRST